MNTKRRRFAEKSIFSKLALAFIESILKYPVRVWRLEFSLFSLAAAVILEIVAFPISFFYGLLFEGGFAFPPWWVHLTSLLIVALGFNKKGLVQRIKALTGLDPLQLRMREASKDPNQVNSSFVRILSMFFFAFFFATIVCWWWYVSIWSASELGADVGIGARPIPSFLNTWFTVVIPNYYQPWALWLVGTLIVLLVLQKVPYARWFLKRTWVLHTATVLLALIVLAVIGVWWYTLFDPVFPL